MVPTSDKLYLPRSTTMRNGVNFGLLSEGNGGKGVHDTGPTQIPNVLVAIVEVCRTGV